MFSPCFGRCSSTAVPNNQKAFCLPIYWSINFLFCFHVAPKCMCVAQLSGSRSAPKMTKMTAGIKDILLKKAIESLMSDFKASFTFSQYLFLVISIFYSLDFIQILIVFELVYT